VLNAGEVPVPLAGTYFCLQCLHPQSLQSGMTYGIAPVSPTGNLGGAFLFVDSQYASQLRYGLRVRDVSRDADGFGTEVPVVRARDFRDDGISLLGIPNQPNLRLTLRLYALDSAGGQVLVRIFEQRKQVIVHESEQLAADTLVAERAVTLAVSGAPNPVDRDNYPAYAQVTDLPMPSTPLVRIDIVPVTSGLRIWAFASATNNTTQQVTVISPH
jgi:hypothetical protein